MFHDQVHNYTPYWLNWIPRKFLQKEKLLDLETYIVELKYTDTTPPFKMEIRVAYTEGNVCKIMSCKAKLQHVSTFQYGT